MMHSQIGFTLSFEGNDADDHEIDFYDMSRALVGFQRSLAITTHLILNNEVITQAPSLKGARIVAHPPEEGSWKILATLAMIGTGAYNLATAPKDTPLGHIVSSAYDYIISENLGFHVDYDKTLGVLYEEHKKAHPDTTLPLIKQSQLDSVVEKCENSVREMHRPIAFSETAYQAKIISHYERKNKPFENPLDQETYDYISFTKRAEDTEKFTGYVSSYNSNTFKGRVYIPEVGRPLPFMLGDTAKSIKGISKITRSLHLNAQERMREGSEVNFEAFRNTSRSGRLKSLFIISIDAGD